MADGVGVVLHSSLVEMPSRFLQLRERSSRPTRSSGSLPAFLPVNVHSFGLLALLEVLDLSIRSFVVRHAPQSS